MPVVEALANWKTLHEGLEIWGFKSPEKMTKRFAAYNVGWMLQYSR